MVLNRQLPDFKLEYACHSPTQRRWFSLSVTPIDMKPNGVVVVHTDITQNKLAEEERSIAAIAFESRVGMVVTDAKNIIIKVNRCFTTMTGYTPAESLGRTPSLLSSGRHSAAFYQEMWQTIREKRYWQGEIWNRSKNGRVYAEWLTISAISSGDGDVSHYVGSFSDITQDAQAGAEIHRLAYYDTLTGLPNRRLLQDRLGQALATAVRSGLYGAVLFLDLDDFAKVNDAFGFTRGDLLLTEVAQRLRDGLREADTLSRLGGDKFVVILEELSSDEEEAASRARQIGDKLTASVSQPFNLAGMVSDHTISTGISLYCALETVEDLFRHADLALCQAKISGRNSICFFDSLMQTKVDKRYTLETELRYAIEHGQLILYYQPQIDIAHRVVGSEALVRWLHPTRGLVSPGEFIPIAEETGLILPLGQWVLETACTQLATWASLPMFSDLTLSVNVSAKQFRHADFVEQVASALRTTGANPHRLKLELTESMLVDNIQQIVEKMLALKSEGVCFSLDDFGTGYSSLSYLKLLPLDQLKIDQSFVRDMLVDQSSAAITKTVIALAQNLGLNVIAEGVETEAQRDILYSLGCHNYQGYFFTRPLPLEKFEQFVRFQTDASIREQ